MSWLWWKPPLKKKHYIIIMHDRMPPGNKSEKELGSRKNYVATEKEGMYTHTLLTFLYIIIRLS